MFNESLPRVTAFQQLFVAYTHNQLTVTALETLLSRGVLSSILQ